MIVLHIVLLLLFPAAHFTTYTPNYVLQKSNQLISILSIIEESSDLHNQIVRIINYYQIINNIIIHINAIIGILTLSNRMI